MGYGFNADKSKHQYNTETRIFSGDDYSTFAEFLLAIYEYIKDSVFDAAFSVDMQGWQPATIGYGQTGVSEFKIKMSATDSSGNYFVNEVWSVTYTGAEPSLSPTPAEYCRAYTMQYPTTSGDNVKGTVTTRTTPTASFKVKITRFTP